MILKTLSSNNKALVLVQLWREDAGGSGYDRLIGTSKSQPDVGNLTVKVLVYQKGLEES